MRVQEEKYLIMNTLGVSKNYWCDKIGYEYFLGFLGIEED